MDLILTNEQQQALDKNHGFLQTRYYVLMSVDAYRRLMGVGSEAEMSASLKAIEEGLADVDAGRTRPFDDVLGEIGN